MRRREFLRAGGLATAVGLAGCSSGGDDATVRMPGDFRFVPGRLTVDAGTTVTWVNEGDVGHSVTADADSIPAGAEYFASGGVDSEAAARNRAGGDLIGPDEQYTHTFEVTGTYEYVCVPHESSGMVGTVDVR